MMRFNEIYVSVDIESDGPIPGRNSMLSLGAAAYWPDRRKENDTTPLAECLHTDPIGTFEVNLELLDEASPDPSTTEWWGTQPAAWAACRRAPLVHPSIAMANFTQWVAGLPGIETNRSGHPKNAVFVGYPCGFDFTFVYWYIKRFGYESPFSFSCLDMKTFAMAVLGLPFRESVKRNMPEQWFGKFEHTHRAVDDAKEQGDLFLAMFKRWLQQEPGR
jgi:hypothetical protein